MILPTRLQELVDRLDRVSRKYSLLINVDKTKVMASDGIACHIHGCSGAGTHGNAVPVNILARERRCHKCVSCKWERWCYSVPKNILNSFSFTYGVYVGTRWHGTCNKSNNWSNSTQPRIKQTQSNPRNPWVLEPNKNQCFAARVNQLIRFEFYICWLVIGSSLLWAMMLWLSVSVISKTKLH